MFWMITKDLIDDGESKFVGRVPKIVRDTTEEGKLQWAKELPCEFRLYDDDGELYYEGKCGDLSQYDEEHAFAPLDWAMSYSGCTTMQYREPGSKEWKLL